MHNNILHFGFSNFAQAIVLIQIFIVAKMIISANVLHYAIQIVTTDTEK